MCLGRNCKETFLVFHSQKGVINEWSRDMEKGIAAVNSMHIARPANQNSFQNNDFFTHLFDILFYVVCIFFKVALKSCLAPRWSETNRSVNEAFIKSQRPLGRESLFLFAQAFFPTVRGQTDSGPHQIDTVQWHSLVAIRESLGVQRSKITWPTYFFTLLMFWFYQNILIRNMSIWMTFHKKIFSRANSISIIPSLISTYPVTLLQVFSFHYYYIKIMITCSNPLLHKFYSKDLINQ